MSAEETNEIELCGALHPEQVFDHYAYGDPMAHNARFIAEGEPTKVSEAITVYVACQREAGHEGKHLATSNRGWSRESSTGSQK